MKRESFLEYCSLLARESLPEVSLNLFAALTKRGVSTMGDVYVAAGDPTLHPALREEILALFGMEAFNRAFGDACLSTKKIGAREQEKEAGQNGVKVGWTPEQQKAREIKFVDLKVGRTRNVNSVLYWVEVLKLPTLGALCDCPPKTLEAAAGVSRIFRSTVNSILLKHGLPAKFNGRHVCY